MFEGDEMKMTNSAQLRTIAKGRFANGEVVTADRLARIAKEYDRLVDENAELREIGRKTAALNSECEELATALSALNVATANMCPEYKKTNLCKYAQSLLEKYGDK